jgi:two-component system chemotaxis response regulator CheY
MKTLIIEDSISSRILNRILTEYGQCDNIVNGLEGIKKTKLAIDAGENYDLIFLDIVLPEINGLDVLLNIRNFEKTHENIKKSKIIVLTSLKEPKYIKASMARGCDSYLLKPLDRTKLLSEMKRFKLIKETPVLY